MLFIFFFNDTATTEIYTLSLHDALPILSKSPAFEGLPWWDRVVNSWERSFSYTYLELASESGISNVNGQSKKFIDAHHGENSADTDFILQPLTAAYLNSENIEFDLFEDKGSWFTIYLFSAIALFILVIACIKIGRAHV